MIAHQYMDIKEFVDCGNFTEGNKPFDEVDLLNLKPLTEVYSVALWEQYISKRYDHPMKLSLQSDTWIKECYRLNYNYENDWNDDVYDLLPKILIKTVDIHPDTIVHFFWSKHTAMETTWEVFLKHWISFLFEDEGAFLVDFHSKNIICFGPLGAILVGKLNSLF